MFSTRKKQLLSSLILTLFALGFLPLLGTDSVAGEPGDPSSGNPFGIDTELNNVPEATSGSSGGTLPAFLQEKEAENQKNGSGQKELPPVKVISEAESEDQLVGPYNQPEWTATHQRWGTTRAYVLPENVYELEVFVEMSNNEGSDPGYEILEELKIGLPNRFQLDLYEVQAMEPGQDSFHYAEHKLELRWALDNWGEIPWNPTLYLEWESAGNADSDGLEYKLLLAETLQPRLHFATNLIFEDSLSEDKIEYGVSFGLSYTIQDQKFSVGLEGEAIREEEGSEEHNSFQIGPAFEWSPSDRTSLRLSPLAGLGPDSTDLLTFLVFGFEFGSGVEGKGVSGPAATETR